MALRQEMRNNSTLTIQKTLEESKQTPVTPPVGEISSSDVELKWYKLDFGASSTISLGMFHKELVVIKSYNEKEEKGEKDKKAEISILDKMKKEWRFLHASFPSRYVVKPIAYCQEPPCILMEYMKNGALDVYLIINKLTLKQQFTFANDIALGILSLLAKGIAHRDIKSANVLVTDDLHAKICDFDLSLWLDSKDPIKVGGTPDYLAPEYFYLKKTSKMSLPQADVFSFGVLLFEIFNLKAYNEYSKHVKKYEYRNRLTMLYELIDKNADSLPEGLDELILDCVDLRPERRPTMEVVQKKLQEMLLNVDVLEEKMIEKQKKKSNCLSIFLNTCRTSSDVEKREPIKTATVCNCSIM